MSGWTHKHLLVALVALTFCIHLLAAFPLFTWPLALLGAISARLWVWKRIRLPEAADVPLAAASENVRTDIYRKPAFDADAVSLAWLATPAIVFGSVAYGLFIEFVIKGA